MEFEDLKSQWKDQNDVLAPKDGAKKVLEKIVGIRKQQQITNIILSATVLILIGFFFYISAFKFQTATIGLMIMIGALVIRIVLEFMSIRKLRNMNPLSNASMYKQQMIKYYASRQKVHFIMTPIIVLTYCIGFYVLLPGFKESLNSGFYNYIIISAIVVLLVLGVFIGKQIHKELRVLKELRQ